MRLVVYLPLIVSVLAAVAARPLAERLPPRTAAWLLTGAAVVLAAATGAGLGLLALAAAVRLPPGGPPGGGRHPGGLDAHGGAGRGPPPGPLPARHRAGGGAGRRGRRRVRGARL